MPPRERHPRRNRFLINIRVEMFRELDNLLPTLVFFNLRAGDDAVIAAGIERANNGIERRRIGQDSSVHLAGIHGPAFVRPVVHGNGNKYRPPGRLHGEVMSTHNGGRYVFRPQRFAGPFHVRLDDIHGPAHKKRFRQYLAAILLPRGYH